MQLQRVCGLLVTRGARSGDGQVGGVADAGEGGGQGLAALRRQVGGCHLPNGGGTPAGGAAIHFPVADGSAMQRAALGALGGAGLAGGVVSEAEGA